MRAAKSDYTVTDSKVTQYSWPACVGTRQGLHTPCVPTLTHPQGRWHHVPQVTIGGSTQQETKDETTGLMYTRFTAHPPPHTHTHTWKHGPFCIVNIHFQISEGGCVQSSGKNNKTQP